MFPGPVPVLKHNHRLVGDGLNVLSHACRMFAHKMVNQDGDIARRCRKRRQVYGKNIETAEEIFAKFFVGNVLLQIAIGGGDLQNSIDGIQPD